MPDYTLLIRDPLGFPAVPIVGWSMLEMGLKRNDVGNISVTLPGDDPSVASMVPGSGIIVVRDGATLASGVYDNASSVLAPGDPYPGTLTVNYPTDEVFLQDRIAFADPSQPFTTQPATVSWDIRSGLASSVLLAYVGANTTPACAQVNRRSILTLAPDPDLGNPVTIRASFDNLLTLCQQIALPDGIQFRALQGPLGPVLTLTAPRDKSKEVVFSYERHNLAGWDFTQSLSAGNWIGVGGSPAPGAPVYWTYIEGDDLPSQQRWGRRRELYVAQQGTTDVPTLQTALAAAQAQNIDVINASLSPVPTEQTDFWRDWRLNDLVTARIGGIDFPQIVEQVDVIVDSSGETASPILGTPGVGMPNTFTTIKSLLTRVNQLERRP